MNKADIRTMTLQARRAMSADDVKANSRAILERLYALPEFARAATVLTFVSSKDNEVNTHPLIETLLREGRTVLVPIANPDRTMTWSRLLDMRELIPARFGILEPAPEFVRPTDPPQDAVVIVPGLAFTPDGHRIGYGGGYFDRFLAHFKGATISLAFDIQIVESIPTNEHDIPIKIVITETNTFR